MEELAQLYRWADYAGPTYEADVRHVQRRIAELDQLLALVESEGFPTGSLVDVGCSSGHLLEVARDRGWAVEGIELDPETAAKTSARLGVTVHAGPGVEVLDGLGRFDLVVMSHWLEHVPDPVAAVRVAARHLTPRGALLLRVPNASSRVAEVTGTGWLWFIPWVHLSYFGPRSLRAISERAGLRVVEVRTVRGDGFPLALDLLAGALRALSRPRVTQTPGAPGDTPAWRRRVIELQGRLFNQLQRIRPGPPFGPRDRGPELLAILAPAR